MRCIQNLFRREHTSPMQDVSEECVVEAESFPPNIRVDNPIIREDDDELGRAKPAQSFAEHLLALDAAEGMVVGVLGPWGSGKTSFINLAQKHLKASGIDILEFNPWMFSGADQLVQAFFIELSSQLKLRPDLAEIGKLIEDYGEIFSGLGGLPLVGNWIEQGKAVTDTIAKLLQRRKQGGHTLQLKVRKELQKLKKPIIVILDDIDRLTTAEIRDMFKLVRLTANFPNIIYLLAFDRIRVEQALGEQGMPGRDYLEKILQIGIDLPAVPENIIVSQICAAINDSLAKIERPGHFDPDIWPDVLIEIIQPLLRNMRDVRRYAAAIHGTVRNLDGKIALVDVLALEAVRIFLPDVFSKLHVSIDGLTDTLMAYGLHSEPPRLKKQIETLIESAGERGELIRDLIKRLFPAGLQHIGNTHYGSDWEKRWLRERRVAHKDILRCYLEKSIGEQLQAFSDAEYAWSIITDQNALESYLYSLPIERVHEVISSLEAFEDQFTPEHTVSAAVVLLNLLPHLPARELGMFDLSTSLIVGRVVYKFVRVIKEPQAVEAAVRKILPQVSTFSSKLDLIRRAGHREDVGHKLVSEIAARAFETEWRNAIRAASPEALAQETDLLRTFVFTKRSAEPDEPELAIPDTPGVTLALLKSARHVQRAQFMDSRTVRHQPRLSWDTLIELYGSEDILRQRIEALRSSCPDNIGDLLELADKYLAGEQSEDPDDDMDD